MPLRAGAEPVLGSLFRAPLESEARLRRLQAECRHMLLRADDEPKVLRETCRLIVACGGYRMAWIGLMEHDPGHTLRPTACAGVGASLLAAPTTSWGNNAFGKGPVGVAVRTGKAQSVADVGSDPIFAPWRNSAHAAGYRSLAVLPLKDQGQAFAALSIGGLTAHEFGDDQLALLGELADDVAFKLAGLRAMAAQVQIERDNQRAQAALRESEERFRALTALSSDFYWETDEQHRFSMCVSGRTLQPSRIAETGLIGKTRWDLPYVAPDEAGWQAHRADLDAHRRLSRIRSRPPSSARTPKAFSPISPSSTP